MISKLHYISQGKTPQEHLENIEKACLHGADWIQLRLKNLDEEIILNTAKKAREITSAHQVKLIINDYYKVAKQVEADGVHLGKTDTCPTMARKKLLDWQIIGGTANTLEDCNALVEKQADYIGLGPFIFTTTKDNLSPILGWEGYAQILNNLNSNIPVIAIGGITLNDVVDILKTKVYGVAVSGEITSDFNTISAFQEKLKTSKLANQLKQNQHV